MPTTFTVKGKTEPLDAHLISSSDAYLGEARP